jgi:hypothetical protein
MPDFLNSVLQWDMGFLLVGSLVVGGLVILSLIMLEVTYRYFMIRDTNKTEIVSLFSSSSGVLYSVLLALITVNAWQDFSDIQTLVETEAYTIGDLYRDLEGYPGPKSQELRQLLRSYLDAVLNQEWPAFRRGERNFSARVIFDDIFKNISEMKPSSLGEQGLQMEILRHMNIITHNHRMLGESVGESVLPLLWVVVWIGAFLNLAINALSASGHRVFDYFLVSSFAINVGLVIMLIFMLDHPFLGGVQVSQDPLRGALELMDHLDSRRH